MSDTQSATIGCISTIRNRIFCTCKLTKSPSCVKKEVHEVEVDHSRHLNTKEKVVSVSPGIVARLMGLESMPESNWVPKANYRSRSVNSITYWSEFDPVHRRIRTSLSLREMPTYLQVTGNDFRLSKSDNICVRKKPRPKEGKLTRNTREGVKPPARNTRQSVAQKKEKQVINKTVQSAQTAAAAGASRAKNNSKKPVSASTGKTTNQMSSHYSETSRNKTRHSLKKDRAESQLLVAAKSHSPVKENPKQRCSKLRRKRQLDILDSKFASRRNVTRNMNSVTHKTQSIATKSVWYLKAKGQAHKLAGEELESFISKQGEMLKMEGIQEVGIEFGLRILEGLVREVVAELSGLPLQNLGLLLMEDVPNSHSMHVDELP